ADDLLRRCDGELKTALVAHQAKVPPAEARTLLQQHAGRVADALRAYAPQSTASCHDDLVIGIDGGGSSTVALLAAGDAVLGRGTARPSHPPAVGETAVH